MTISLEELTQATLAGSGVFDVLMRANKAYLDAEFSKNRISGKDYASVYLGSLEAVMRASLEFLLQKEKANLEAAMLVEQTANLVAERKHIEAQTKLLEQQTTNAETETLVLQGQKCKLDAEYDLTILQKSRTSMETTLLTQRVATEKAQITGLGVDADSVVGRQKALYKAQTDGYQRDAEQKAAKIMADTWTVRRTTDEGTSANDTNLLSDAAIGRTITKLLSGVGA